MALRGSWAALCPSSVFSALGSISTELVNRSYMSQREAVTYRNNADRRRSMYIYEQNQDTHRHVMGGATGREQLGVEILLLPLQTSRLHL